MIYPYKEKCSGSLPYNVWQEPIGLQTTFKGNVGFGELTSVSSIQRARPFLLRQPACDGVTYPYVVKCSDLLPYSTGHIVTGTHTTLGLRA